MVMFAALCATLFGISYNIGWGTSVAALLTTLIWLRKKLKKEDDRTSEPTVQNDEGVMNELDG